MGAASANRYFPVQARGELREDLLTGFAIGARAMVNPATGQPWTAQEIAAAIAPESPQYVEADALDLVMQLEQQRGLWLADQPRVDRASTQFLVNYHAVQWELPYLPATGGTGTVSAPCAPGTTFFGSTTLGDPAATVASDLQGNIYQVLFTVTSDASGDPAELTLAAISTGVATNLAVPTALTWSQNVPLGTSGQPTVDSQFQGGLPAETDAQYQKRLLRYIRHKEGGGNRAQLAAWAAQFSNAVDVAFVYSSILYAGTALLCAIPKRANNVRGPSGRIASSGLVALLTAYLVPPGSTTTPDIGLLLVTGATSQPTDMLCQLQMPVGTVAGWADYVPWPAANTVPEFGTLGVAVFSVASQTSFEVACQTALPPGVTAPQMMAWDVTSSSFVELDVQSVVLTAFNTFTVTLNAAPNGTTLAVGTMICPLSQLGVDDASGNQGPLALAAQDYFDGLGPGEVVDVTSTSTDPRRARAYRFVTPQEEYSQRAGSGLISAFQDALVGSVVDGIFIEGGGVPSLPTDPSQGPGLLTLARLGVYPL
jgi:hypothetical protein